VASSQAAALLSGLGALIVAMAPPARGPVRRCAARGWPLEGWPIAALDRIHVDGRSRLFTPPARGWLQPVRQHGPRGAAEPAPSAPAPLL